MSWRNVRGHDDVLAQFRRVLDRGRLAHAYLFVGPEGIGKKLFARTLARGLLCEATREDSLEPCGRCPGCLQVDAETHPDYQFAGLPPEAHEFPVDAIQDLIRRLAVKPARGRRRIAIVDDADAFSPNAANCFLKTLEEPPPFSLLILIGTSTDRFLPTITSRCQVMRFARLAPELTAELLRSSGVVADAGEALRIARLARGNVALARTLADPDVLRLRGDILGELAKSKVDGVGLAARINSWTEQTKDSAEKRRRATLAVAFLVEALRASLAAGAGLPQADVPAEDQATVQALARGRSELDLLRDLESCLEADWRVERRVQLALVVDALGDALAR